MKPRSRTLKERAWLRKELAWAKAHPHSIKTTRYRIVTPTLRRLERAAMRWWRYMDKNNGAYNFDHLHQIEVACAAHAQSQAGGKRRKRHG